tara:strand:+ start:1241 stop:1468 length:228 start_codon:yes stop_codon:yes gene_type:complete
MYKIGTLLRFKCSGYGINHALIDNDTIVLLEIIRFGSNRTIDWLYGFRSLKTGKSSRCSHFFLEANFIQVTNESK